MGFDGGSMSIYDALLGNTKLIISDHITKELIQLFYLEIRVNYSIYLITLSTKHKKNNLKSKVFRLYFKITNHWASIHNSEISNYSNSNNKISLQQEDSVKEFRSR